MLNVKDILAVVRVCVLGALLFAPLTSNALPANDDHVALPDAHSAAVPDAEECRPLGRRQSSPLHDSYCISECGRVFDACRADCRGVQSCTQTCSLNHSFCIYGCNSATRG